MGDEGPTDLVERATLVEILGSRTIAEVLPNTEFHHILVCDGCHMDPIIGNCYTCTLCECEEDLKRMDYCSQCYRRIILSRIQIETFCGEGVWDEVPTATKRGPLDTNWVYRHSGKEGTPEQWMAAMEWCPCVHRGHVFKQVRSGPFRALVYRGQRQQAASASPPPQDNHLETFLSALRPSKVPADDLAWLHCSTYPDGVHGYTTSEDSTRIKRLNETFRRMTGILEKTAAPGTWNKSKDNRKKKKVTVEDVNGLAKQFSLLGGKWMLFLESDEVDRVWEAVVREMVLGGGLGACDEVKVSVKTTATSVHQKSNNHVLIAYVKDYMDQEKVEEVLARLRKTVASSGVSLRSTRRVFKFKPDIYTHLGLYSRNEFGLQPTTQHRDL